MSETTNNRENIAVDPLNDRVIKILFTKNRKNPKSIWLLYSSKKGKKTFFYYRVLNEDGSETLIPVGASANHEIALSFVGSTIKGFSLKTIRFLIVPFNTNTL